MTLRGVLVPVVLPVPDLRALFVADRLTEPRYVRRGMPAEPGGAGQEPDEKRPDANHHARDDPNERGYRAHAVALHEPGMYPAT